MTGPTIIPMPSGAAGSGPPSEYRVICVEHRLDRTVNTEGHANNLLALHLRVDHPGPATGPATLDVTATAALVLVLHADPIMAGSTRTAALHIWEALTGLDGETALAYAREVAGHQTTAVVPPF